MKEVDLAAYAHQELPFEKLVEALNPKRSMARHPLFQVMLAFDNNSQATWKLSGVQVTEMPVRLGAEKFDLSFSLCDAEGELLGAAQLRHGPVRPSVGRGDRGAAGALP